MSLEFVCPTGGLTFAVRPQASGPALMCVSGEYGDKDGDKVRVLILPAPASGVPSPDPSDSNCRDGEVVGQVWCVPNVPVPTCTPAGTALVVYGWVFDTAPVNPYDQSAEFTGQLRATGGNDCCAGCGSGSGAMMAPQFAQAAATLSAGKGVRVTVPDGPDAGHHSAAPTAQLTWQARVGTAVCEVKLCPTDGLLVRVDGKPVEATDVQYEPVSALLPGTVFGATGPVLVSQA
ncbi:hypothetical protein [Urbifossiella limnaea]|uniref:Uncharacterized protein n=1 Tax=Urbifossiella limnaea TaxID=2528023 RepID=A0A517XXS8_9BACT|nr:hypothetical protein [Urbifossiella limnaea]QDU22330.1 hypothetical protein ETAA1_43080 [Urbifossiella limnaea]